MKRPLIFSGTTEGRHMSERLSAAGIDHIVCVATGYGELVMEPAPHAEIWQGRLTADEMEAAIKASAGVVFDATHPYAHVVSENIRVACKAAGTEYVRVYREEAGTCADGGSMRVFNSAEECAEALGDTSGGILLTTGSKELHIYAADPEVRGRLHVRVLPSEESIRLCHEAGIAGKQIIAMQGPFSREMDAAVIKQYDIRTLVTKSSGKVGGYEEKTAAARDAGIDVFVIGRPIEETGFSAEEALRRYFRICPEMHIDLVGIGPGRGSLLTAEAKEAIACADIIFGAARMAAQYADRETYPYYLARDIIPVLEEKKPHRAAILFSGDTGYCSGAAKMAPALAEWLRESGYDYEINTHPGISSFAYLAARTGVPYTDAALCSLHGKSGDQAEVRKLIETVRTHDRTFLILSGAEDVRLAGTAMAERGLGDCRIILGDRLSYPEEKITELSPAECSDVSEPGLYTALILNENAFCGKCDTETQCGNAYTPESGMSGDEEDLRIGKAAPTHLMSKDEKGRKLTPVISDDSFIRGKVPMTKENIRHLSVVKLDIRENSVVYDIGSGTGSVACEIAGLSGSVRVYAVEMKEEACALIRQNAEHFALGNIEVVRGKAPEALEELEIPTHAFIGGSSGNLREIMETLRLKTLEAAGGIRVVINAVSLETISELHTVLKDFDIHDLIIEQIAVSRSRELGTYHLMTAENPVMIASFTIGGDK